MTLPKSLTTVTPFSKAIALFLFILLPFAGFYAGYKYQGLVYKNTPVVQSNPTQAPISSPSLDETVSWKTFTSIKWGVKFKYPKDWTTAKETDNGIVIIENNNGYGAPEVDFYILENNATKTALLDKIKSYPVNKDIHVPLDNPEGAARYYDIYKRLENKNVDNYTAVRYTIDWGYKDLGVSDVYAVSILKGTKVIEVRMTFPRLVNNKVESRIDFVDKILSTFKFTQ